MALIFKDTFTDSNFTNIVDHTPDTGTSWTKFYDSDGDESFQIISNQLNDGVLFDGLWYTANATYPSADYAVQADYVDHGGSGNVLYLFARLQDVDNLYAVRIKSSGTNPCQLYKKVSGTWTALGSAFSTPAEGSKIRLEVVGTSLKFFENGVLKASATDSDITDAGKAALGFGGGAEAVNSSDSADHQIDNFYVSEIEMTVVDSASTISASDPSVSLTVQSGDILIACIGIHQGSVNGVTWNGTSLTQGPNAATAFNERAEIWYSGSPEAGTHTLTFDGTGGGGRFLLGLVIRGASGTLDASNTNTGSDASIESGSVTPSVNGALIIDSVYTEATLNSAGSDQQIQANEQAQSFQNGGGSLFYQPEAAAKQLTWALSSGQRWASAVIVLIPTSLTTNTKTFTVDGIVKQVATKTFTVDGIVKAEQTETFTVDGVVKASQDKTFTIDGIVKAEQESSITVDGVVLEEQTKTFTTDGIVKEITDKTFTVDGVVLAETNKTFTIDGLVKASQDKTFTVDGIILEEKTSSFTIDAVVKEITDKTFTVDGIVLAEQKSAITVDGVVLATNTKTFTVDGVVKEISDQLLTIDGIVRAIQSSSFTVDGIVLETITKTFTVDGVILEQFTKTFTVDGIVLEQKDKTFTVDAVVKEITDKTFTVDGIILEEKTKTFTVDGIVKQIQSSSITIDGVVLAETDKTFTVDGIVLEQQDKTFTVDGIVKQIQTSQFTVDGIVKQIQTSQFTVDGNLVNRFTKTFTVDGHVVGTSDKTFTVDAEVGLGEKFGAGFTQEDTSRFQPELLDEEDSVIVYNEASDRWGI